MTAAVRKTIANTLAMLQRQPSDAIDLVTGHPAFPPETAPGRSLPTT